MADKENQLLILRDNARAELEQIKSLEDGLTYLNKVKSIEVWVKAEKKDAELQNMIAEQKLRTQRILGKLIHEGQEKGDIADRGERKCTHEEHLKTLEELSDEAIKFIRDNLPDKYREIRMAEFLSNLN